MFFIIHFYYSYVKRLYKYTLSWTEALTAFIIPKKGEEITADEIIAFCKTKLGGFKVPKEVVFVEAFPATTTGKIQKHILKENFVASKLKI